MLNERNYYSNTDSQVVPELRGADGTHKSEYLWNRLHGGKTISRPSPDDPSDESPSPAKKAEKKVDNADIQRNIDVLNDFHDKILRDITPEIKKKINELVKPEYAKYKDDVEKLFKKQSDEIIRKIKEIIGKLYGLLHSSDRPAEVLISQINDMWSKLSKLIIADREELGSLNSKTTVPGIDQIKSFGFYPAPAKVTLTLTESNFIFGKTREKYKDILALESTLQETSYKSVAKMNGHISSLEKKIADLKAKLAKTNDPRIASAIRELELELSQQKMSRTGAAIAARNDSVGNNDPLIEGSNTSVDEDPNEEDADDAKKAEAAIAVDEALDPTTGLKRREENIKIAKNKEDERHEKKVAQYNQQLEKVKQTLSVIKGTAEQPQSTAIAESQEILTEAATSKYESMLFNGYSGDALKFFINGEINNTNKSEIGVAKFIENDKEVKEVIKKIKWLLKKLSRLRDEKESYDMYIELKVQKNKFRTLFTQGKHRLEKQYK